MRNGLNISNVSEFVHELRECEEEASVRYRTQLRSRAQALSLTTKAMDAGTIRAARAFPLLVQEDGHVGHYALATAPEYLMIALAGCVMVTFVYGASAKGVTLTRFAIEAKAEVFAGPDGEDVQNFRYVLDVDADCEDEVVAGLARYVSFLSPNHRTLTEANQVALGVKLADKPEKTVSTVSFGPSGENRRVGETVDKVSCTLDWTYGTQFHGVVESQSRGHRPIAVVVDQPKQYLGLDSGANPQEYLFGGLSLDLASSLRRALGDLPFAIGLSGALDLRGVLNIESDAVIRVHQIDGDVLVPSNAAGSDSVSTTESSLSSQVGQIQQALDRSGLWRALCEPKPSTFEVRVRGRTISQVPCSERLLKRMAKMVQSA